MRLNIDKLMIGFVMILAVCLYAPTILEDYKTNNTTNEKVEEVLAEAPVPARTTETVELAAVTTQENIREAVDTFAVADNSAAVLVTKQTPKFQMNLALTDLVDKSLVRNAGMVKSLVETNQTTKMSELMTYVNTLPVRKEIKPSLMAQDEMEKAKAVQANYESFLASVREFYAAKNAAGTTVHTQTVTYENVTGDGKLTASKGVNYGPSGKETYYNLNMSGVVDIMQNMGYNEQYWVREDGVKMYGEYVMVAADLNTHPRGSLVESSLGTAIVVDTGGFAASNPNQLDIATSW